MNNNVYVRDNKSILSISITRILCLLPLIIYGFYKNGIYLYMHHYVGLIGLFKPLIIIITSAMIGALVNIIYERAIKKNEEDIISLMFSSFHIEYSLLIACMVPININYLVYYPVLIIILCLSKFFNERINIVCVIFLVIYGIMYFTFGFDYLNAYETSKTFSLNFMDYMIGKASGGIAATHIIIIILSIFILYITNNNKTSITISSIITSIILFGSFCLIANSNFCESLLINNYIFSFTFIATDSIVSSYTNKGTIIFGILVGVLTFGFYFLNPIIAPYLAIMFVSLFNNFIDRKANVLNND